MQWQIRIISEPAYEWSLQISEFSELQQLPCQPVVNVMSKF